MTEELKERVKPGKKAPNGVSITSANQHQVAPLVSVYRGPEPDAAYLAWAELDSRGKGAAVSEWFELRRVTPDLLRAAELALLHLSKIGTNQQQPVMVTLKAAIAKAKEEL